MLEKDIKFSTSKLLRIFLTDGKSKKWLSNWKSDVIKHNIQQDGTSCGIHVIEVLSVHKTNI